MQKTDIVDNPEVQKNTQLVTVVQKNAGKVVITNDAQAAKADMVLTQVKTLKKNFEAQRLFFTKPLNDQVKKINELFKGFTIPLLETEKKVSAKIIEYRTEQERIAAEAQRKTEAEAARLQKKLDAEAAKTGTEAPQINVPTVAPLQKIGNSSMVKQWTFKVKKESLVPREYMMIDQSKVNAAIRAGERKIKGLEIFQKSSLSTRTK